MLFALRRLLAYILDIAILYGVLAGGLQTLTRALFGVPDYARLAQMPVRLEGWVLLTISLPTWLYFIICDVRGGSTLGKRVLGLRTRAASGGPVGLGQAVARTALKLIPWELTHISVLVPNPMWNPGTTPAISQTVGLVAANLLMLAYLVVLVLQGGHRSVHDLIAGTSVEPRSERAALQG
ncbi:MAG TPA: RDD family protein [Aggregatilineales bacterium]|nr:RDD family protein [Aggregatilineales bacterium]